jgi:uncharacterized protein DUF5666
MNTPIRHSNGALRAGFAALAALLLAAGCGGGGGDNMPSGRAFTQGTITGFGSIIVNGIRFDDSTAQVSDDDGQMRDKSELKLGMIVEVESTDIDRGTSSAKAIAVRFGAAIVGPVSAISAGTTPKTLTVLDQIVEISATTVFDDSLPSGFDSIKVDDVIEVHALLDSASGHYLAKRIEPEPGAAVFKLRGVVANLDTTAKTFMIGGALIDYSGVAPASLPSNFSNGLGVRVLLQTAKNAGGQWVAIAIRADKRQVEDRDEAEVEGTITDFTSTASFSVNGLPVDASKAAFPDGTAGIVKGAEVEVEGAIVNGVLVASKVELEDERRGDERMLNELHGPISGLNTQAKTFVVRGVTVHYGATTMFQGGAEGDLADGKTVEVKGTLSAGGTMVEAALIRFEPQAMMNPM